MKYAEWICIGVLIGGLLMFCLMMCLRETEQDRKRCRNCGYCSTIVSSTGKESVDLFNCAIGRGIDFRAPIDGIYRSAVLPNGCCDRWTPDGREESADG